MVEYLVLLLSDKVKGTPWPFIIITSTGVGKCAYGPNHLCKGRVEKLTKLRQGTLVVR